MNKDINIKIIGIHADIDNTAESDEIITIASGKYYFKNNSHYILFEEINDNHIIKNKIQFRDNYLLLTKSSELNSEMEFTLNKITTSKYQFNAGKVVMNINTHKLDMSITDESIDISIEYDLLQGEDIVSRCKVIIHISQL